MKWLREGVRQPSRVKGENGYVTGWKDIPFGSDDKEQGTNSKHKHSRKCRKEIQSMRERGSSP